MTKHIMGKRDDTIWANNHEWVELHPIKDTLKCLRCGHICSIKSQDNVKCQPHLEFKHSGYIAMQNFPYPDKTRLK